MSVKVCKKCGLEKPESDFTIGDKHYGYRKAQCKSCEAQRVRRYYAENEVYRTRVKLRARGLIPSTPKRSVVWDEATQTKVCGKCKRDMPLAAFARQRSGKFGRLSVCAECRRAIGDEAKRSGRWKSWTPEEQRRKKLADLYGITPEDYDELLGKQNGSCALCGSVKPGSKSLVNFLMVDHDHNSGRVRGLLCATCNMWLGNYESLIKRAGEEAIKRYLEKS